MNVFGTTYAEPTQLELSREAARRHELAEALHGEPTHEAGRTPVSTRVRHALALRLVATARLIDAT